MSIVTDYLLETATYWGNPVADGFGGFTYAAPVAVAVRWQNTAELFRDVDGIERTSSAVVYSASELTPAGYLLRGASTASQPSAGAREVRSSNEAPSIDNTERLFKAFL